MRDSSLPLSAIVLLIRASCTIGPIPLMFRQAARYPAVLQGQTLKPEMSAGERWRMPVYTPTLSDLPIFFWLLGRVSRRQLPSPHRPCPGQPSTWRW